MDRFDRFVAIDWSGAKGEYQKGIAVAEIGADGPPVLVDPPGRLWSRQAVQTYLETAPTHRTLIGMDLGISLPFADAGAFFPGWSRSPAGAKALWALVDEVCADDPHLESGSFVSHPQASCYFRHSREHCGMHFHLPGALTREGRFREAERAQRDQGVRPVSNFNLVGAAQVGKSSLTGMRMLNRLRGKVSVWPIDPLPDSGPVLVEMYTSIAAMDGGARKGRTKLRSYEALNEALAVLGSPPVRGKGPLDDHSSDALVTAAWLRKVGNDPRYWHPERLTDEIARTEGWTFGVP